MAIDPVWFAVGAYVLGAIIVAAIVAWYFRK
jgi:hypothetical protein